MSDRNRPLSLLFAASEATPWVKSGGLGDVMGALPAALADLDQDVTLVLPLYGNIDREAAGLKPLTRITVPFLGNTFPTSVYTCVPHGGRVRVLFLENQYYFERDSVYTDLATGEGWHDNDERFFFFQLAIVQLLLEGVVEPDVLVLSDWHTSMLPALIRIRYRQHPGLQQIKLVLGLHNLGYQGVFPAEAIDKLGLSRDLLFPMGPFEFYGKLNCLKAGISMSDRIITVSPGYAEEILGSEQGCGLDGVLRQHRDRLHGVLNGIDTQVWNPGEDRWLPYPFTAQKLDRKSRNRVELLREFGLDPEFPGPVIGIVSRLTDQKGIKILAGCLDRILSRDLKMVVLGSGEKVFEQFLLDSARANPGRLGVRIAYSEPLAHLVEGGADMFLMPSLYEPCGLNQMYSMTYGTLPIVRHTGGLKNTVIDFLENADKATGFHFYNYNAAELLEAVDLALAAWKKPKVWRRLQRNGMKQDFSWRNSASEYLRVFRELVS
ncbi:MAG: glycogen synthase GlgA [Candidatus Delongbacteria bacterium]|nr:glycogen synthase GlgA [Candidatus Delongbacteria bacterium]